MNPDKIILSQQKYDALKKELEELKRLVYEHRKQDAEEGTMSYSFNDAAVSEIQIKPKIKRIKDIENILKNAQIQDANTKSNKIILGSNVQIELNGKIQKIQIVDPIETNPLEGKISFNSPLGEVIFGKKENESFKFRNLSGKIVKIS